MEPVILGISPGTRHSGYVVLHGSHILDMDCRETRNSLLPWIQSPIEKYRVEAIAMKEVPPEQSTDALETLYDEIRQLARNTGIFLSIHDMETLRGRVPGNHPNKRSLFRFLASVFPELELPYQKMEKSQCKRACRLMEALTAAVVYRMQRT